MYKSGVTQYDHNLFFHFQFFFLIYTVQVMIWNDQNDQFEFWCTYSHSKCTNQEKVKEPTHVTRLIRCLEILRSPRTHLSKRELCELFFYPQET